MMTLGWRSIPVASVGLLLLLVAVWLLIPGLAAAQSGPQTEDQDVSSENLITAPGIELGRGQNTQPTGRLGLTSYRVEQVPLSEPQEVAVAGQSSIVTTALRLTVSGGPFVVRATPYVVWIDGNVLGAGQESVDLSAISIVTLDPTVLRNGSTIAVSEGFDPTRRVDLPDKLSISPNP
jgi:hypothetical protein